MMKQHFISGCTRFVLLVGIVLLPTLLRAQVIIINHQNAPLDTVLKSITDQTDYKFVYSGSVIDTKQTVSVNISSSNIATVLDAVFRNTDIAYRIEEKQIALSLRSRNEPAATPPPTQTQTPKIFGIVLDDLGLPLPGAFIQVKGDDTKTTVTDAQGRFEMTNVPPNAMLAISFMGFEPLEIRATVGREMTIRMTASSTMLQSAVATGYSMIDRRILTSSIATIKADELEKLGALTVDQMIEGKAPGLMVMNISATPGAASKIRVRSTGTFVGSREPLWVVDGVPYEDPVPLSAADINSLDRVSLIGNAITGLNPQDIEDINILKDASATAIYGTRAANGVIVITTRRGQEGTSPTVSYHGSINVVMRPTYGDFSLMNSKERIDVSREMADKGLTYPLTGPTQPQEGGVYMPRASSFKTPVAYEKALMEYWFHGDFNTFQNEVSRLEQLNYDWFKELYRPAFNQSHSVNISGGTNSIKYYFSIGYNDDKGAEIGAGLTRLTARSNLDINLRKNVLVTLSMDGSVQKGHYNRSSESVFSGMPYIFDEAYYTSRAVEAKDEKGNLVYIEKPVFETGYSSYVNQYAKYNILNERDNYYNGIDNKAFNVNVGLRWDIFPGIRFTSRVDYRNTTTLREEWVRDDTYYTASLRRYDEFSQYLNATYLRTFSTVPFGGIYSGGQISQETYGIRNQLNFTKMVGAKHFFNLDITQEARSVHYNGVTKWEAPGYVNDQGRSFVSLPNVSVSTTSIGVSQYSSMIQWLTGQISGHSIYPTITERLNNTLSYLGIFTYSYDNKYIANFNIRTDGSNTFGQYERYKFRPVWSASARWNIHEEGFLKEADMINELALRASYGVRGQTPNATPYLTLSNYGQNNATYYPEKTATLSSFPNANLRWEVTQTTNLGLSYSFFENRLSGVVDYEYSYRKDLLLRRPVSLVNGIATELYNGGSMEAHTFEFDVRGEVIKTNHFRWVLTANVTRSKESIIAGTNVVAGEVTMNNYLGINSQEIIMKGFPVDGFYSYRFTGLNENGMPTFAGLYQDFETDYEKIQALLAYQGGKLPDFYGGFGTSINYREFTLSANFSYKIGQMVRLLALYQKNFYLPYPEENTRKEFVNRWRKPSDVTDIPALTGRPELITGQSNFMPSGTASLYRLYDLSDLRTARGDHIRCQSITLSYRAPKRWTEWTRLSSAMLNFQVQNPFIIVFDKKLKGQDPEQVSSVGLPTLTSFNMGLNISF